MATRHPPPPSCISTPKRFSWVVDIMAPGPLSVLDQPLRQPVEMLAQRRQDRLVVEGEIRLQVGDLLERLFEPGAGVLGVTQRVHERDGVIGTERTTVPRRGAPALDHL